MGVDLHRQVEHLFNNNSIETISQNKLKINGKGRIYNQTKPPSKILTKVVNSLYNKQFTKEPKPTRHIRKVKDAPPDSAQVSLKHDTNDYEVPQVNRNRFSDFINDHEDSQNKQTNPLSVELKFRIETKTTHDSRNNRNVYKTRNRLWWRTGLKIIHKKPK